jgi:integrase
MLRRRQKQAGLPYLSPHRLGRHTFISQLLNRGASTADAAKAARSSEQMIAKVYGHLEQSRTDRLIHELPVAPLEPDHLKTQLLSPSSAETAPETMETEGNSED